MLKNGTFSFYNATIAEFEQIFSIRRLKKLIKPF